MLRYTYMACLGINIHETENEIYSSRNLATSLKRHFVSLKLSSSYFRYIDELHQKLLRLKASRSNTYTAGRTGCLQMTTALIKHTSYER
jgi:hypothetical protein